MSDQETLLTVVIEAPEPLDRESTTYRRLLAARLQWQDHFNIVVHDKVIRTRDVADLCESSKSRYIVFIRQSHQVSAGFLATLLKYLSKRVVYIAEPLRFNGSIPAKLENIKVDARYHYSRDSDLYGVVLNTGRLRDALEAIGDLDRTALYLAYRLYWSIAKVNPIAAGYSVASDTISAIGYQIDTDYGRLLPLIPAGSTEIRLMVLRYVVLYLRGLRETEATGIKLTDLRETVKTFELISLVSNAEHMHPFECAWIQWLADPQESQILFKQLSDADAYVQFSTDCDEDEPTTVLHTINFRDTILVIGRTYRSRELRAELRTAGHYDFYRRPITTRSTMLFFDRPMQADDNAEYLYSHFVSNNPDYKHVYFALNPKSPDWERLASRGFNLVAFFSSEFYEIFLRSDIVVASQIYNLRYKGKTLANSRFVYLQHGVQLNDMSTWVESKLFDVFVATGKVEADYLKTVAPRETLNSGLPRLESLRRASTNTGDLLFMPTWRFNLHQTSCEMFKSSLYFRAIKAVLTDRDLIDYLERNDITLQVKLHPNIEKRADLFDFSKRVVKSEASYREAISAAAFVFTDYSSAVLDAAFIETPIAYYQWDESSFFADQPYKSRLDYRNTRTGLQSARRHHRAHYSESLSTYCCRLSIPQRTLLRRCGHREDQRENHREDAEPVKNPMRAIRAQVTKSAKNIAYSSPVRNAVRDVVTANYAQPLRDYFEAKGLEDRVRRFTSESLPDGKYFAKLTIKNWQPFAGKPFALSRNGVTVYGNEIEPPAKGFPLEYRNIIVDSTNVDEFDLDIDSPFELLIGRGSFTTPQQVDYDKKYDVRQHGDVYYSLRGNTTAPRKMIVTFPGFGPSTSRISYAVSYLKQLSEDDLNETVMVCFQDRYLAAGSYMLVDNAGQSLVDRVNDEIISLRDQFGISDANILLFGASKGGSIAIQYADKFPDAQLVVAVPQMNLKYYLDKPFFKNNLFCESGLHEIPQPEKLMRRYLSEKRSVHYFYTNSDEQSNFSVIESASRIAGLSKYRFDGTHGEVAKKALPTLVGLIRRFIDDRQDVISSTVDEFHIFAEGDAVTAQLRVDDHLDPGVASNWYLEGEADDSRFYQVLSDHSLEFVKYTSVDQALYPQIDHLDASWRLVNVDEGGRIRTYEIPNQLELQSRAIDALSNLQGSLRFDASDLASYTVVSGNVIERFVYQSRRGLASDDTVEVHLLEDLDDFDLGFTAMQSSARFVVAIESVDDHGLEDLLVNRFFILSACSELRIVDDRDSLFSPVPFEASTGIFHEVRKDTNKYARSDIKANPSVTA